MIETFKQRETNAVLVLHYVGKCARDDMWRDG